MAKIGCRPNVAATITLHLSEEEAGALDALVGYGFKTFIDVFYKHLGKAYLEPYESGLKSLFESVRTGEASVHSFLEKAREARAVFDGRRVSSEPPKFERGPGCETPKVEDNGQ